MIVLLIELMEPELMHEDAGKRGGTLLQELRSLDDTPGNGMMCLYSFPSLADTFAFATDCFGTDPDTFGTVKEVVPDVFYQHVFG